MAIPFRSDGAVAEPLPSLKKEGAAGQLRNFATSRLARPGGRWRDVGARTLTGPPVRASAHAGRERDVVQYIMIGS